MSPTTVADLMTPEPLTVSPDDHLAHVYDLMARKNIRHLPVTEGDSLVGMLSHRDLVSRSMVGLEDLPISHVRDLMKTRRVDSIMVVGVETAHAGDDIQDAAERMFENKFGCLPVVEGERVVGILTESDFVRHIANRVEA